MRKDRILLGEAGSMRAGCLQGLADSVERLFDKLGGPGGGAQFAPQNALAANLSLPELADEGGERVGRDLSRHEEPPLGHAALEAAPIAGNLFGDGVTRVTSAARGEGPLGDERTPQLRRQSASCPEPASVLQRETVLVAEAEGPPLALADLVLAAGTTRHQQPAQGMVALGLLDLGLLDLGALRLGLTCSKAGPSHVLHDGDLARGEYNVRIDELLHQSDVVELDKLCEGEPQFGKPRRLRLNAGCFEEPEECRVAHGVRHVDWIVLGGLASNFF
jgi:hypothetical protein